MYVVDFGTVITAHIYTPSICGTRKADTRYICACCDPISSCPLCCVRAVICLLFDVRINDTANAEQTCSSTFQ